MQKTKSQKELFDVLELKRVVQDGRFYNGRKGLYFIQFINGNDSNRVGKVILNRKFLTGLFRTKYSSKVRRFIGDLRNAKRFLIFDFVSSNRVRVYTKPKDK
jgi:hypothetical protein